MNRRELARHLAREAAKAMPADEVRKFKALLGGTVPPARGLVSLPGDGLPPITVPRKCDEPLRQPTGGTVGGGYYGQRCACGVGHERNRTKSKPEQLRLL